MFVRRAGSLGGFSVHRRCNSYRSAKCSSKSGSAGESAPLGHHFQRNGRLKGKQLLRRLDLVPKDLFVWGSAKEMYELPLQPSSSDRNVPEYVSYGTGSTGVY